jgi:hypothetical protein
LQGKRAYSGRSDSSGVVPFVLRPEQHVASLRVKVSFEEELFEFEQTLPVIPGSYSLRKQGGDLEILSPLVRGAVWYTFLTTSERLGGGRLALLPESDGTARATLRAENIPETEGLYVLLASEADGRSPSTVGFPLDGQARTFDAWDAYLLDGEPRAKQVAELHRRRVRWTLGGYAALVGLLTLVLFVLRVKQEEARLAKALAQAGASEGTADRGALPLVIAVLCLFFAFSLGVLWIVAR